MHSENLAGFATLEQTTAELANVLLYGALRFKARMSNWAPSNIGNHLK